MMSTLSFVSITALLAAPLLLAPSPRPAATPAPTPAATAADANLSKIKLPAGFRISYFAQNVPGARELAVGSDGTVYVGTNAQGTKGKVYALPDKNRDGKADAVLTVASGLNAPNGVAVRQGSLYVAEINRIIRLDNIAANLKTPPKPVVVYNKLPDNAWHGYRYIAFGPDGMLYVPVGAPCNTCEPEQPIFGTINRLRPDGTGFQNVALGVRNTVGFDWHPVTKEMWFTDNGRDQLGDNLPADELNRAPKAGLHFGFPYLLRGRRGRPGIQCWQNRRHVHQACPQAGRPRGRAGHEVLHRHQIPGPVPQPDFHPGARLVEPQQKKRLPHLAGEAGRQRPANHRLPNLRRRLAAGPGKLGPPRVPAGAARRFDAGERRPGRRHFPHFVRRVGAWLNVMPSAAQHFACHR
ncbi:MAG TPA: PQQ-dependent sugar dehydrogenase [Hymenobacter sp.]|jgi:hypothetical protein|uniref:PQQ-dependent sugar dehydrogenase n=1 Tax=Hymenobacter sp. TaxID=1898978 RepID=UPI002EDB148C